MTQIKLEIFVTDPMHRDPDKIQKDAVNAIKKKGYFVTTIGYTQTSHRGKTFNEA